MEKEHKDSKYDRKYHHNLRDMDYRDLTEDYDDNTELFMTALIIWIIFMVFLFILLLLALYDFLFVGTPAIRFLALLVLTTVGTYIVYRQIKSNHGR